MIGFYGGGAKVTQYNGTVHVDLLRISTTPGRDRYDGVMDREKTAKILWRYRVFFRNTCCSSSTYVYCPLVCCRQVSAIIDVDKVPQHHRRVRLLKHGSDKPLGNGVEGVRGGGSRPVSCCWTFWVLTWKIAEIEVFSSGFMWGLPDLRQKKSTRFNLPTKSVCGNQITFCNFFFGTI